MDQAQERLGGLMDSTVRGQLREVGIVALVPEPWGGIWMARHQVLTRLAGYFPVVWMHEPGWRECLSPRFPGNPSTRDYPLAAGMQLCQPKRWLPRLGRPAWLARLTSRERLKRAYGLLRAAGCKKRVLYLWRPAFADALQRAPHDLSIYHVCDEYSFSAQEVEVPAAERRLLEGVGQVLITSPALMKKKGGFNPNTEYVPNGVDYRHYATPTSEPDDLRSIPHPRIGYVGHIKQMLDWPLLLRLSVTHPELSFIFVGPRSPHAQIAGIVNEISRQPNVYFLGGKPTEQLGAYPQHFDVCMMPYRVDDYTKYIYPLKMHEYLASGRPVISTPVRSVIDFRDVITVAENGDWSKAIERALSNEENTTSRCAERQRIAREHDWDILVERIASTIATRLGLHDVASRMSHGGAVNPMAEIRPYPSLSSSQAEQRLTT